MSFSVVKGVVIRNLVQMYGSCSRLSDSVTFSSLAPTWFNAVALDLVRDQHLTIAIRWCKPNGDHSSFHSRDTCILIYVVADI